MHGENTLLGIADSRVDTGSHIIYLYDSRKESPVAPAVRFAQAGLSEGDTVVCVVSARYREALISALPGAVDFLDKGSLVLPHPEDVYLDRGVFAPEKALAFFDKLIRQHEHPGKVRYMGFSDGIIPDRVAGLKAIEYESMCNIDFPFKLGVCFYDTTILQYDIVRAGKVVHPLISQGSRVRVNKFYQPPDQFLNQHFYIKETLEFEWRAEAKNCRAARMEVAEAAARMPFTHQEIDDILLAVGEALANAVRHGSPRGKDDRIRVRIIPSKSDLTIQIIDEGCGELCEPQAVNWTEPGGKGLYLMRQLCDSVDYHATKSGCTVTLTKNLNQGDSVCGP